MVLLKRTTFTALAAAGVTIAGVAVAVPSIADTTIAGTYNAVTPTRVLDTRTTTGGAEGLLASHKSLTFKATSASASAVLLTVTVLNPASGGYLVAYQGGAALPAVSTLNFEAHHNVPNAAVVKVGSAGTVSIYNGASAPVNVLASLSGYWTGGTVDSATAGALETVTPSRILDSRVAPATPIPANSAVKVTVAGKGGVPAGASAVLVNIAASSKTGGYLTADAEQQEPAPMTSILNFGAGLSRANLATVPVNPDGTITLYNGSSSATTYFVDAFGYFLNGTPSDGGSFLAGTPTRVADTRGNSLGSGTTRKVQVISAGQNSVLQYAVLNVAAVSSTSGYVLTYDGVGIRPTAAIVSLTPGITQATTVVVPINADGTVTIYNGTASALNAIVDVQGYVLADLSGLSAATAHTRVAAALASARTYAVH